jgi:hypothetical protein
MLGQQFRVWECPKQFPISSAHYTCTTLAILGGGADSIVAESDCNGTTLEPLWPRCSRCDCVVHAYSTVNGLQVE